MYVIILAGGGGSRLWPLSNQENPKQFIKLGGNYSLLQQTALRFYKTFPAVVVTVAGYESIVRSQLEEIGAGHFPIVLEPMQKSTAPAIALALRFLETSGRLKGSDPVLVAPSDHVIAPETTFFTYLNYVKPAIRSGKIVLFGIRPRMAETGFGYVKIGEPIDSFTYQVESFVEKPDKKRAEEFLLSDHYYWNSGMLAFTASSMWSALKKHLPKLAELNEQLFSECIQNFSTLPAVSMDHGILEKNGSTVLCPLPIEWFDLGSWDQVYESLPKDDRQNVKMGNVLDVDTKKCLIFADKKQIVTIGLEDIFIIDTEEAIFVGKKGDSQKLKELALERASKLASKTP